MIVPTASEVAQYPVAFDAARTSFTTLDAATTHIREMDRRGLTRPAHVVVGTKVLRIKKRRASSARHAPSTTEDSDRLRAAAMKRHRKAQQRLQALEIRTPAVCT